MQEQVFIGGGNVDYAVPQYLKLKYANSHGLIAGATGTGKTVKLLIMAEEFSKAGVPVFLSDVKGDLSGLAKSGSATHKLHEAFQSRAETLGFQITFIKAFPVSFGNYSVKQAIPSVQLSLRWGLCCCLNFLN